MKLTAELSLYPLQEDYIPVIKGFIDTLHQHTDLEVVRTATCTQVCGDYERVFAVVAETLAASTREFGKQVLVTKFIPWEIELSL
jgi:uncharacterized protein YqgV (UPF0045/DUF77 family)